MRPLGLVASPTLAAHAGLLCSGALLPDDGPADPLGERPRPESLAVHLGRLGPRPLGRADLVARIGADGLTGHGGAHVPAVVKWQAALAGSGPLTVVANGAESEPVAAKDGTLLRQRPHLVIDGLVTAAEALGAGRAVVWLHGDDHGARAAVRRAVAERPPGELPVEVLDGPVHYLAGEASAITRAVLGGPALPTARRRPVLGRPRTLVHNVETLARVALLARGLTPPATRLLTVLGEGRVVVEVGLDVTVGEVLAGLGWVEAPQAVLLGGYGGLWASWDRVARLPVAEPAMRAAGLSLGAGVLAPLGVGACGVRQAAALIRYLASMSARQCGPCLFGLPALADAVAALADGRPRGLEPVLALAAEVEGRGACHHPDGATRLAASALTTFAADVAAHASGHPCDRPAQPWPGTAR